MRMKAGLLAALMLASVPAWTQEPTPLKKKIIEWGWDTPGPIYVRDHIREMEQKPFDGIIMQGLKVKKDGQEREFYDAFFGKERSELEEFSEVIQVLKDIKFQRFTDNFIRVNVVPGNVDWFDDFGAIVHNAWVAAKIAKEGGMKGWMFDVEQYAGPVFNYPRQKYAGQKTFEQYARQVGLRGREFMVAVNDAYPGITIMLTFGNGYCYRAAQEPGGLEASSAGLLPAFLEGMLAAATPETTFVDGNEPSYYYNSADDYFRAFHVMKQGALSLVSPANRAKYGAQVKAGVALYMDYVVGVPHATDVEAEVETATGAAPFERSVQRLATLHPISGGESPPRIDGLLDDPVWQDHPPLEPFLPVQASENDQPEAGTTAWVTYDDDMLYVAFRCAEPEPDKMKIVGERGDPEKRVRWFEHNVYYALTTTDEYVWCYSEMTNWWQNKVPEGAEAAIRSARSKVTREQPLGFEMTEIVEVFSGDCAEVFVSTGQGPRPYRHFIVNPHNIQWEAQCLEREANDARWDAEWQSGTHVDKAEWTAEIAIPWEALGGRPAPGTIRRANLCRAREAVRELSTWSLTANSFLEADRMGVWEFAR